jgi:hypothetical protein
MMALMLVLFLVLALAVVAAGVVGAVVLTRRVSAKHRADNQVVPGRETRAPASWAGAHTPEAVLHRRLRDAMKALRANQAFDHHGVLLEVRVELEEQAVILDDHLVAVAALPRQHSGEPLERVTEAVSMIEKAVSDLASRSAMESGPRLQEVLAQIQQRASLVDEIRTELDRLPSGAGAGAGADGSPVSPGPVPEQGATGGLVPGRTEPGDDSGTTGTVGSSG